MGAGKSTIGRLLASKLNFAFVDTDQIIEDRTGADIPWIFDVEGEDGFRDRETSALTDAMDLTHTVIATGGGIVERETNRLLLKKSPLVVYLTATIEQLVQRTSRDKKRPLLQVDDPKSKIIELFESRDPLYQEVATHTLMTDNSSPKNVVQKIVDIFDRA